MVSQYGGSILNLVSTPITFVGCSTTINVDGQLMSLVTLQYDKEMMLLALPALRYPRQMSKFYIHTPLCIFIVRV